MEACDVLTAGLCSPACLLAMETPQGWPGCKCPCRGRFHAALTFARVPGAVWASGHDKTRAGAA